MRIRNQVAEYKKPKSWVPSDRLLGVDDVSPPGGYFARPALPGLRRAGIHHPIVETAMQTCLARVERKWAGNVAPGLSAST